MIRRTQSSRILINRLASYPPESTLLINRRHSIFHQEIHECPRITIR
ncbi:unnamed protein product [Haemonchus placei]|uniref:Uncharacterized protein n=2 Tax=Haemonchus TaxID=6288 RepID=A0A0N4VUR5_HAEPC|nr:unnamed protein product [Haemonchus placei]